MTVSVETNRVSYNGAASVGPFDIPFYFLNDADLLVIVSIIADGSEVELILTTDYTLTGAGVASGGTLTLTGAYGALPVTKRITIIRDPSRTQTTDYEDFDRFPAQSHERGLDRVTMVAIRAAEVSERSLRQPDGDVDTIEALPPKAQRASTVLGFDADGNPVAVAGSATVPVSSYWAAILTLTTQALSLTALGFSTFFQTLITAVNQAAFRLGIGAAASGANTDITSLAAPSIGAATAATQSAGDSTTKVATTAFVAAAIAANPSVLPLSLQDGGKLSNNVSDATNDIDIAAALWSSDDTLASNRVQMLLSAMTKQLDAAWAVGTNQGMRDTGSIANGTWHIYAIKRTDTNVVDVLASLTSDRPAATVTMTIASPAVVSWTNHGLVAGASVVFTTTGALPTGVTAGTTYYVISSGLSANSFQFSATQGGAAVNTSGSQSGTHTATPTPVMPANYTKKRRIGSILRESAAIVAFHQWGDTFLRKTPVLDVSNNNPGTSANTVTISVPTGAAVEVMFNVLIQIDAIYVSSLDTNDMSVSALTSAANPLTTAGDAANYSGSSGRVLTNMSAQIRYRCAGNNAMRLTTLGWVDLRGRGS